MQAARNSTIAIEGYVEPQFAAVVDAFIANFQRYNEVGAALAVYHRGELVVDLAAGLRDRKSEALYTRETLQPVFSITKGITALAANMLLDRGQLDLDAPVVSYWPEFGQHGKSEIPVRWLLTHQSGVLGLDRTISLEQLMDWDLIVHLIASHTPYWEPGSRHGSHSMTYGFLLGEVVRRATGQTLGQFVAREIAEPLEADLFVGVPAAEHSRIAAPLLPDLGGQPPRLADSGPYAHRVLSWISPPLMPADMIRPEVMAAEIPAANGIANARSLARMFAATIGSVNGFRCLSPKAMGRARAQQWRGLDAVMGVENAMGLGFLLPTEWCPLGGPGSFGSAGFGGSRAWANPDLELAFAYLPNLCSMGHFDAREAALGRAVINSATRVRTVDRIGGLGL